VKGVLPPDARGGGALGLKAMIQWCGSRSGGRLITLTNCTGCRACLLCFMEPMTWSLIAEREAGGVCGDEESGVTASYA